MLYYHNFAVKETKDLKYFAKHYNISKEQNWDLSRINLISESMILICLEFSTN